MENLFDLQALGQQLTTYAPKVIGAILTLVIGFWVIGRITSVLRRYFDKKDFDKTVEPFLLSLVNVGLKIMLLLAVAQMFGIQTTSFVAIFSALAFAIGLALQGNLGHMAAGILILIFRPFKVGDYIVSQGYEGTVKEIQIFTTILTTLDNRIIIIPNGAITSGPIENLTAPGERKVPMVFGIGYPDDIDKAREIIQQVADACPDINHDKPVDIFVLELGDSSVNFAVRPWTTNTKYWDVHFYMHENIKKEFDKAGIGIPFPQMDVHINQVAS
ncbi:MAG: mechanosensitive ion channel domain-containing protein [Bacteroidota bacterium]